MLSHLLGPPADPADPYVQSRRRAMRTLRTWAIVFGLIAAFTYFQGVVHVQWTYTHYRSHGTPTAHEKLTAEYLGLFGWRSVRNGEYGDALPGVLLIPLEDCVNPRSAGQWILDLLFPPL